MPAEKPPTHTAHSSATPVARPRGGLVHGRELEYRVRSLVLATKGFEPWHNLLGTIC